MTGGPQGRKAHTGRGNVLTGSGKNTAVAYKVNG